MTEKIEPEPAFAKDVFGTQIDLVRFFTRNLVAHGEELGLIGPAELSRIWTRHIVNCGVVAPLLSPSARVADVGSGAGLPGIVLALSRPDSELVLIEPMERRANWLLRQVDELGLDNVEVVRARAEDYRGPLADQVTARAVSALRTLIPLTAPLVKPGGELILMKGAGAQREIDAASKQISRYRLRDVVVQELGSKSQGEPTWVVRAKVDATPR